jgi:hypothetical protein
VKRFNRWTRSAAALAVVAVAVVPATAVAEPKRTATTTKYTRATYLQHALGLPAGTTNPVIESVTYDRFQHLLQQSGNFAILIGDPATDATFAARARDVEAAAKTAGAAKVYWFNPNLSGNATVGAVTVPNLDIRNSAGITSLSARSQGIYGKAWLNLVGQYLGNGVTATQLQAGTQSATVEAETGTATVNDSGSTEVGNPSGGALYDYSGGSAPADVQESYFLIYNKANTAGGQPAKVVSWIDLTDETASPATQTKVTTAINTVGAANLGRVDQFDWWKSEANLRQNKQAPEPARGGDVPVVTDADKADGWRVNQISYPELVDLLEHTTDADAVILFGGTWCPNTRAVLPFVNKYAQENNVTVYNFDTVLDGGIVGGGTTASSNPLQSRNNSTYQTAANANPSFLFGEAQSRFVNNLVTEYNPASNGVAYFPGGDSTKPALTAKRLQVPYLIGYKGTEGDGPNGGVTRQWIRKTGDTAYREYMSQWYYTNPKPGQLGLTTLPQAAPIWATINSQLANFSWRTDPATLLPNTATDTDDAQYLVAADTATVTYTPANGSTPASVSVASGGANPIGISPAVLSTALAALGTSAPANLAGARAALIAAESAATPDATLIANLRTVVGAWGVAQQRKTSLLNAWGSANSPGSVAGGAAAVRALDIFFGGLPGGVVSTRTVTVNTVKQGTAPAITVAIANEHGRKPAGNVSLVVRQGGTTVASASTAVSNDAAAFTLPALAAGTYDFTLSYAGDDQLAAFTETGSMTVSPADVDAPPDPVVTPVPTPVATPVVVPGPPTNTVTKVKASKVAGAVAKAPTRKAAGRYKVTITTPKGRAKASGKVTLKLKKGKTTKTITGTLKDGTVTVKVPKLARGTWKVTLSWAGDSTYLAGSAAGASIKVTR